MSRLVQVILPLKLDWIPFYRDSSGEACPGDKVRVRFAGREYIGVVSATADSLPDGLPEAKVRPMEGIESKLQRISPEELELWNRIAAYYLCTVGEVYKTAYPAQKLDQEEVKARLEARRLKKIATLEEKLAKARTEATRARYAAELAEARKEIEISYNDIELSEAQKLAYSKIIKAFGQKKPVLLKGVTGSGKTEIYEKLALETLKSANVLYLVPEIALSRQLEERLRKTFGESLLVFHSHETTASRGAVASRIARTGYTDETSEGRNYIVLGTRSALFLPHHDLGLIIVDEEHDGSYKQDSPAPRYNGRDVAVMMAGCQKDCRMIMGSATPSLESAYNCQTGRYSLVELNERYHGGEDSDVEVIDTIAERKKRGMMGSFSYKLINHINDVLADGGQVMILRGRRSYSPALQCNDCGSIPKCPKCNVPLSRHIGATERLLCHRCGWSAPFDGKCSSCGGEMHGLGAGTQKIEEEAAKLWPNVRVARLDSDITSDRKEEAAVIRDFSRGDIKILVGTQIVSKGFDFEDVALVAVLQADSMLGLQDFRADEKALQLLEQFRGRCGRRGKRGLFVIQTANPEHPVYSRYVEDSPATANLEGMLMEERKDFSYPPYTRMVELTINDSDEGRAGKMMTGLVNSIYIALSAALASGSAALIGPFRNRLSISLAKDRNLAASKKAIAAAVEKFETDYKYRDHVVIDVDPA